MLMNATLQPQRAPRVFQKLTRLSIQLRGAATLSISTNQGEAATVNDGVQITQAGSGANNPPYDFTWKGELWFVSNVNNTPFVLLVIGD